MSTSITRAHGILINNVTTQVCNILRRMLFDQQGLLKRMHFGLQYWLTVWIAGRQEMVPHHVFLVHEVRLDSVLHLNMGLVGFHSIPFRHRWYVALFMPITVPMMLAMWASATPFHACEILFDDFWSETWVVPRFGFPGN